MGFSEDSSHMFCYGHSSTGWCTFKCHTLHFTVRVWDYTCGLVLPILCKVWKLCCCWTTHLGSTKERKSLRLLKEHSSKHKSCYGYMSDDSNKIKKKHCEVMLVQFGLQSKPLDDLFSWFLVLETSQRDQLWLGETKWWTLLLLYHCRWTGGGCCLRKLW